jgi:hypothetical protein
MLAFDIQQQSKKHLPKKGVRMALESLQFIHLQVTNEVSSSLEGNILQWDFIK